MNENQFVIHIDYDKTVKNPERVFLALAKLVSEFSSFDSMLCESLPIKVDSRIVLDKVEEGSVKAFLSNVIENIDDEALANLDIKRIIGCFLVKGKYKALEKLNEEPNGHSVDLKQLQTDLLELSTNIKTNELQTNQSIPLYKLAQSLDGINNAMSQLSSSDKMKYITKESSIETKHNSTFSIAYEKAQLIEKDMTCTYKATLVVKKPDLLGDTQWEFKYNDVSIKAKIEDEEWLANFHNREIVIQAKDSLNCNLRIQTKDIEGAKPEATYTVTKVHEVIQYAPPSQQVIDITISQ